MASRPLEERKATAASDVMRFVAAAATSQGFTQESLARELRRRTGRSITGANVGRHFDSSQPHAGTVKMYAQVLGIADEVIDILSGRGLTPSQEERWRQLVWDIIGSEGANFTPGTVDETRDAFDGLNPATRRKALEAIALEAHSALFHDVPRKPGWPDDLSRALITLAKYLLPSIDLKRRIRSAQPSEDALSRIWSALRVPPRLLSESEIDTVIRVIATVLRAKSMDVESMFQRYEQLSREDVEREHRHRERQYVVQDTPFPAPRRQTNEARRRAKRQKGK
jgi:hypothetical protein